MQATTNFAVGGLCWEGVWLWQNGLCSYMWILFIHTHTISLVTRPFTIFTPLIFSVTPIKGYELDNLRIFLSMRSDHWISHFDFVENWKTVHKLDIKLEEKRHRILASIKGLTWLGRWDHWPPCARSLSDVWVSPVIHQMLSMSQQSSSAHEPPITGQLSPEERAGAAVSTVQTPAPATPGPALDRPVTLSEEGNMETRNQWRFIIGLTSLIHSFCWIEHMITFHVSFDCWSTYVCVRNLETAW